MDRDRQDDGLPCRIGPSGMDGLGPGVSPAYTFLQYSFSGFTAQPQFGQTIRMASLGTEYECTCSLFTGICDPSIEH